MSIERPITHDDPDVSVVIPTIPANSHEQVVDDLREQTIEAFEVLVVNSKHLSVCEARNRGVKESTGPFVAFTDDDCRPPKDWVENIVDAFEEDELVIVEGPVNGGMEYNGKRKYPTCNVAVRREVARSIGGFRVDYEYWREDTEFGWRMEQMGSFAYDDSIRMCHPDNARSEIKLTNEMLLKEEYPDRYDEIIIPDTYLGKINDWLWRRRFWDAVDRVRT